MVDKLERDVLWNVVSFAVLGISGIAMNVLVGRFYGPEALGVFNQVFALFIFLSQFAAFGIHYSVVKHVAEHASDTQRCNAIVSSAVAVTAACSLGIVVLGWFAAPLFGRLFSSPDVGVGWRYALVGLFCFSMNKVLLAVLNGLRHMRTFAGANAARWLLIVAMLGACIKFKAPAAMLPIVLSGGETCLMLYLLAVTLLHYKPVSPARWEGWGRRHVFFGLRGFLSGTLIELNSRVDVLMLGYFLTDRDVGIYSFAALIVEGIAQLPVVVRTNVNPLITQLVATQAWEELQALVRRWSRITYAAIGGVAVVAVATFPLVVRILVDDKDFESGWMPFATLLVGLVIASGYLPFAMMLVQAGRPGHQSMLWAAVLITNAVLNAILIPTVGLQGAAYATAIAFVAFMVYLKIAVHRVVGVRI